MALPYSHSDDNASAMKQCTGRGDARSTAPQAKRKVAVAAVGDSWRQIEPRIVLDLAGHFKLTMLDAVQRPGHVPAEHKCAALCWPLLC